MAFYEYIIGIISTITLLFLFNFFKRKAGQPMNFPIIGMAPSLVLNFYRLHEMITDMLAQNGGTFYFKGVWFTKTSKIFTCDLANVQYIFSTNFSNYEKGEEAKEIFDVHGDWLFNADHDQWTRDRKMVRSFFSDPRCTQVTEKLVLENLENGLIPLLEHFCEQGEVVDLQDLFTRLMLDSICELVTGYKPSSLTIDFPETPLATAMDFANDRIIRRHVTPTILWKFQRWLGVGEEKKMTLALQMLDSVAAKYIKMKTEDNKGNVEGFDALKFFMMGNDASGINPPPPNVLRDILIVLTAGGRDTVSIALTWLCWLIEENPTAKFKIREELEAILPADESKKSRIFSVKEVNRLPYLHSTICECLRLYPPAPYQQRVAVKPDILPSGHKVNRNIEILFSWYALGRMKSIWGNDCLEFKPERWLSEKGEVKYELANKYLMCFSSGPRVCPGKSDAYARMKAIVAAIIYNYDVKLVKGHPVVASASIGIRMEHGLMVNITRRWK